MQQSHSGAHQKQTEQAYRDLLEEVGCALWDDEVFVDSLQLSMAGRGQTWGCEEVRSLMEIAFAVCSALIHYFPAASVLHSQKVYFA